MKDIIKFERPAKLKVLFADDEPALQELMHLELPRMGHEVTVCPDGNTAVAALEKNTYDCIIVDLDMPGMNGIQVIGKCKELSPDTDAVVLTGKSTFDTASSSISKLCSPASRSSGSGSIKCGRSRISSSVSKAKQNWLAAAGAWNKSNG
jgi:CheY-like chemotaxis protein